MYWRLFYIERASDHFSESKTHGNVPCLTPTCQVWEALGCNLATGPIAAMVLHLSIGDTWNHINNVEKKLGVAVSVVFLVVSGDQAAGMSVLGNVLLFCYIVPMQGLFLL